MRIRRTGRVKGVLIEIPVDDYQALEQEKARTGRTFRDIILGWIAPQLAKLPRVAHPRIES